MALKYVSHEFDAVLKGGSVLLESDERDANRAYAELLGVDARNLAIKTAAVNGMSDPRINGNPAIVLVDPEGKPITDPKNQKVGAYRARIDVIKKLV